MSSSPKILYFFLPKIHSLCSLESNFSSAGPGAETTLPPTLPPGSGGLGGGPILAANSVAEGKAGRTGDFGILQTVHKQEARKG